MHDYWDGRFPGCSNGVSDMSSIRSLAVLALAVLITSTTGSAFATPFMPVLDEFWILKGSTQIFRDSFNDGVLPPSGPDDGLFNPTTYSVFGPGGMTSESAGKLTLTPSLGAPTVITTTFADVATDGVRLQSTVPGNPNFLGVANSFEIHGLFDMSSLPTISGQSFGIRATDRATGIGNEGDNTYLIFVGMSNITGDVTVFLRQLDFVNDLSPILASVSIQSLLTGADQIELILAKAANSNLLSASYRLYDYDLSGDPIVSQGGLGELYALYNNEDYIRAQFSTTDRIPVPEPGTLALLGLGLAAAYFVRRRRTST